MQKTAPTVMVPMADLLNHVPHHNAELKVGETAFTMVAVNDIGKVSSRCLYSVEQNSIAIV